MSTLQVEAERWVEEMWSGEGGVGGEAVGIGLCNATDMVAEHGPITTAGSSSPGGEQVTLQSYVASRRR